MASNEKQVSVQRVIDAPAEKIFDVVADPNKHPLIDGSGTVKQSRSGPARLELGAKFGMSMRQGLPYLARNKVVEFDEGRRIGWCHLAPFAHNVWRYELEPAPSGTRVVETYDWSHGRLGPLLQILKVAEQNREGMERTLERLDKLVTTGAPE
jgi:uncharacterized protein YndB with AHSA1/START domain